MPIDVFGLCVATDQRSLAGRFGEVLRRRPHCRIALESALQRVFSGHRQGLRVMFVLDQVGFVVADVRAFM
jgi:hypothetical protein